MDRELEFYTVQDIINILHLSQRTTYKLVHKPDFPKIRIGNRYLIPKKDFERWVSSNMYKQYKI